MREKGAFTPESGRASDADHWIGFLEAEEFVIVRIRTATAEDVADISEINVRGWQAAFRGLFPDAFLDSLNPRDRDSAFAERVTAGPSHHTAVAVDEDEIIGFVGLEPPDSNDLDSRSVHEIWGLYIEPQRFGSGVGRVLVEHAIDHLRAGDWEYAILWTLRDVERTCRFYEAGGWYRDGGKDIWEIPKGNRLDLVRYRFDLMNTSDQ